jgi:hypothetical protein
MKNVKKLFIVTAIVMFAFDSFSEELGLKLSNLQYKSSYVSAKKEKKTSGGAAHSGMVVLQADFNLGSHGTFGAWYWGPGYPVRSNFVPGFTFNADFGVHDYASVGPYIGFGGRSGYFQMALGVRGVFHWWQLLDDKVASDLHSDKIDFYIPIHLGVMMDRFKIRPFPSASTSWHAAFNGGGGIGFRYYFVKQFGINMELGWQEMSYAKLGFTFQIR